SPSRPALPRLWKQIPRYQTAVTPSALLPRSTPGQVRTRRMLRNGVATIFVVLPTGCLSYLGFALTERIQMMRSWVSMCPARYGEMGDHDNEVFGILCQIAA